jgi:hypothetical protein
MFGPTREGYQTLQVNEEAIVYGSKGHGALAEGVYCTSGLSRQQGTVWARAAQKN